MKQEELEADILKSARDRRHQAPREDLIRETTRIAQQLGETPNLRIVPRSIQGNRTALEINGPGENSIFLVISEASGQTHAVMSLDGQKQEAGWHSSTMLPDDTLLDWAKRTSLALPPPEPEDGAAPWMTPWPAVVIDDSWLRSQLAWARGEAAASSLDPAGLKALRDSFMQAWSRKDARRYLDEIFLEALAETPA